MADVCMLAAQALADCVSGARQRPVVAIEPPAVVAALPAIAPPQPASAATPPSPTVAAPAPLSTETCARPPAPKKNSACNATEARSSEPTPSAPHAESAAVSPQALPGLTTAFRPALIAQVSPSVQAALPIQPQFSRPVSPVRQVVAVGGANSWGPRPQNGSQLYAQRRAALQAGHLFTRIAPNAFREQWQAARTQPTHQQWRDLLAQEARAVATGQGHNRLSVVVGDSLSLWMPSEVLPRDRFWLNQGISGETTGQILQRLSSFAATRPDTIYLMAGVNDLKNGTSNRDLINNMRLITRRLHQQHPNARIVVHSILPTRLPNIPSSRVRLINQLVANAVEQEGAEFVDLQAQFADTDGNLNQAFTTDGVHLNPQGYRVWQTTMLAI